MKDSSCENTPKTLKILERRIEFVILQFHCRQEKTILLLSMAATVDSESGQFGLVLTMVKLTLLRSPYGAPPFGKVGPYNIHAPGSGYTTIVRQDR